MAASRATRGAHAEYREVDATHAGQRLDNFLIAKLKGVPRSHIYRILRRGEVRINRGRRPPEYRLQAGDVVRIPPLRLAAPKPGPAAARLARLQLEARILYEDDDLLVVDKAAGMAVHGGSGVSFGLIEALRALRPQARFLELAHRLDRDTSGCLLVAKRRPALLALHAGLRVGTIDKRYLALVQGRFGPEPLQVRARLHKYELRYGERMVEVAAGGKDAATHFAPRRRFADCTLVEIRLLTGRTHQARVHAAHAGHPIAGDPKYGAREFDRRMRRLGLGRLFLHASQLAFAHPLSGEKLLVKSRLPADLRAVLERLEKDEASL